MINSFLKIVASVAWIIEEFFRSWKQDKVEHEAVKEYKNKQKNERDEIINDIDSDDTPDKQLLDKYRRSE